MARLIPKVEVEEISVKSERDVAKYLVELLPDSCVIYHSYPWLKAERNDKGSKTLLEGETDFVVLIPSHGLLVLEVKGGEIQYDETIRKWSRVRHDGTLKEIQDPFVQVERNMHYLTDRIRERLGYGQKSLPFNFGHAVVFPDSVYNGPTPPGADPAIVFSAKDLEFFDRKIKNALNQWSRKGHPAPLTSEMMSDIQLAISPSFKLLPVLYRRLEEQEEKLVRLTDNQHQLMEFLATRQRACINGVAGSGKTLLAKAQAQKFANQGKKVLLVCYNKNLASWISDSLDESFKKTIKVRHFHGLCRDICMNAKVDFSPDKHNADEFWSEIAPDRLLDAIDLTTKRYDAIIVDEGQDFLPNWWLPLEVLNSKGDEGAMFVFFDPRQNLYANQAGSLPDLGTPFELPVNCRNTKRIAAHCGEIIGAEVPTRYESPLGIEPEVESVASEFEMRKHAERCVHEWVNKGKLRANQIAILSPNRLSHSSFREIRKIKGIPITESVREWKDAVGILFSSVKAFKGLEADAIVMIDVPMTSNAIFSDSDYYVGCSRAKHMLNVIQIES